MKASSPRLLSLALLLVACGGTQDPAPAGAASGGSGGSAGSGPTGGNGAAPSGEAPTWHADIAPLVAERCAGCHQEGGIAPFSLQTYEQAKMWSPTFDAPLRAGSMPPFLARETDDCQPRFGFKDDPRLTAEQIELFKRWDDAGCPEGDPAAAAPVPEPADLNLAEADLEVKIPAPVTIEGTGDKFICFSLAPDFTPLKSTGPEAALLGERVLIDGAQVHPGNAGIVHHVLVYTDAEGKSAELAGEKGYYDCFGGPQLDSPGLLMAWAPGATPVTAPEGVAMALPSTGRIVMQVHYHPSGSPQVDDATSVQLRRYRAGIPEYIGTLTLIGNARGPFANGMGLQAGPGDAGQPEFRIPAGAEAHTETMSFPLPRAQADYKLWAVGSHMHYVGTDMRIGITRAAPAEEPAEECLLDTPHWDFNWQRGYLYDVPIADAPSAKGGDVFNLRCTYDNSMNNPFVQSALSEQGLSAPRDVRLGEETLDEMCLGIFGIAQKVSDLLK
ncbi:MAG: hypothetical protein EOO73_13915 [Myxococcales bacterium]|nr:MAG: hypothetical protein EOO73_13915 [Myxococcales bacterium]